MQGIFSVLLCGLGGGRHIISIMGILLICGPEEFNILFRSSISDFRCSISSDAAAQARGEIGSRSRIGRATEEFAEAAPSLAGAVTSFWRGNGAGGRGSGRILRKLLRSMVDTRGNEVVRGFASWDWKALLLLVGDMHTLAGVGRSCRGMRIDGIKPHSHWGSFWGGGDFEPVS